MLVVNNKVRHPQDKYNIYWKFILLSLTLNEVTKSFTFTPVLEYFDTYAWEWQDVEYVDTYNYD